MRRIGSRRRATASAAFFVDARTAAGASSAEADEEPPIDVAATAAAEASSTLRRFSAKAVSVVLDWTIALGSQCRARKRNDSPFQLASNGMAEKSEPASRSRARDNERERDAHFDEVAKTILSGPHNQCVHRRIDGRQERRAGPLARPSSRR